MTDDALIEAMAKAMSESGNKDWMYADDWFKDIYIGQAIAALAVARPIIEAPLRTENEKLRETAAFLDKQVVQNDWRILSLLRLLSAHGIEVKDDDYGND